MFQSPYLGMSLLDTKIGAAVYVIVSVPILGDVPSGQSQWPLMFNDNMFQSPYLGMSLLDGIMTKSKFRKFQSPYLGMSLLDKRLNPLQKDMVCFSPHTWGCPFWTIYTRIASSNYCFSPHTWGCPFWTILGGIMLEEYFVSVPILGDVPSGL